MDVASFDEIAADFNDRVSSIVWATVATNDRKGRLRSRVLHPIWEGSTGWIVTGRQTLKTKHLAVNPFVSVGYWDQETGIVTAECRAEWDDDPRDKQRVWDLFKNTPPPYGYDPGMIWAAGPTDPAFGLLRLVPWRIELSGLQELMTGKPPRVWRKK